MLLILPSLLFPLSFRASTTFLYSAQCYSQYSQHFPLSLAHLSPRVIPQPRYSKYFQASSLPWLVFLTFCYRLSLHHWNCSRDFCFLKWCCLCIFTDLCLPHFCHLSANFIFPLNTFSLAFTTPSSLLPFDSWGFLFHPYSPWKSQQPFSLLALPVDQYPVTLAAFCISDVCVCLGLFIHPVLHFS